MEFNRWWVDNPDEVYWLEVTDREDIGVDLNAPQQRDDGREYYGYSLITEVREGDIVFHYHKDKGAIVAWSKASGSYWSDNVIWGARGTAARLAGVRPYLRAGWRHGLEGIQLLRPDVRLEELRDRQEAIQAIRDQLEQKYGSSLYFPFEASSRRDLRPTQAYLTKLPFDVLALFPALNEPMAHDREYRIRAAFNDKSPHITPESDLGTRYCPADENSALSELDPFQIDPALVERANQGHATTQNALAAHLLAKGWEPRSPNPYEPNYDIAWKQGETVYVAEIKSLTDKNQEKQLRLGLGQVLRYSHLLMRNHDQVKALLVTEREPIDTGWVELCAQLGIVLTWPSDFARIIPELG